MMIGINRVYLCTENFHSPTGQRSRADPGIFVNGVQKSSDNPFSHQLILQRGSNGYFKGNSNISRFQGVQHFLGSVQIFTGIVQLFPGGVKLLIPMEHIELVILQGGRGPESLTSFSGSAYEGSFTFRISHQGYVSYTGWENSLKL